MTDREKLLGVFEALQGLGRVKDIVDRPTSINVDGRRFGFNERGELESIQDGKRDRQGMWRYHVRGTA